MPTTVNGAKRLKQDLQTGEIGTFYLIWGEEAYLKEYYTRALIKAVVDDTFRAFNLQIFEGKQLTPEQLNGAVESCPAMAERKLILVRDFDLLHSPAAFRETLPNLLADLPAYVCLVFLYDMLELKWDKRLKLAGQVEQLACIAEFPHLSDRELIGWIRRRCKALGKGIEDETCAYWIFRCGNSMTRLIPEIEKAAAFSVTDVITQYHIDSVCSRILDAVIFDLTDDLARGEYQKGIAVFRDLMAMRQEPIAVFSAVLRHFQRVYAAKLLENSSFSVSEKRVLLGTRSAYYARKLTETARKFSLDFLRRTVLLAAETDIRLKSSSGDAAKWIELTLLQMAANFGETA